MRLNHFLFVQIFFITITTSAQKPSIELTFTGMHGTTNVQLDSIIVTNMDQGGDTTLYWPDTVLVLNYQLGMEESLHNGRKLAVYQDYPDPAMKRSRISVFIPEKDQVQILLTDASGRNLLNKSFFLEAGMHAFYVYPERGGIFLLNIHWQNQLESIKILGSPQIHNQNMRILYNGKIQGFNQPKATANISGFSFNPGNELRYLGYNDTLESGLINAPAADKTDTLQFAMGIPCPGMPIVNYEGKAYKTVQIYNQCWFMENINVGTMIQGDESMHHDGEIEKYCFGDHPDSCLKYGGLYRWDEMMKYTTQEGTKGICPPGWHIPADHEWSILEGSVDYYYSIGDPIWANIGYRGFNAGEKLKTNLYWANNGNGNNVSGFSVLPAGYCINGGTFQANTWGGYFWTSSQHLQNYPYCRILECFTVQINHNWITKTNAYAVRCLRDY